MHSIRLSRLPASLAHFACWAFVVVVVGCDEPSRPRPDLVAPTVEITEPANGSTARSGVELKGTLRDSVGVERAVLRVNDRPEVPLTITPGSEVSFSTAVELGEGRNTLVVAAYDAAGNRGEATVSVILDGEAPSLVLEPVGSIVSGTSTTVRGTATDADRVARLTYQVNGAAEQEAAISPATSVSFQVAVPLAEGRNRITLHVYDAAGNRESREFQAVRLAGPLRGVVDLSAAGNTACAVVESGKVYCWGHLPGVSSPTPSEVPVEVGGDVRFRSVSVGLGLACGVAMDGAAYCWGSNAQGRLGNGGTADSPTPVRVAGGLTFRSVSAGDVHSCGVTSDDRAYCWGGNGRGELGDGTTEDSPTPVAVSGGLEFQSVSAGFRDPRGGAYTCGITTTGDLYCWGWNSYGRTRLGIQTPVPGQVSEGTKYRSVTTGAMFTLAVTASGTAWRWGGVSPGSTVHPRVVSNELAFSSFTASDLHWCGVAADGTGYCGGYNLWKTLGRGETSTTALGPVTGGIDFEFIDARPLRFTCGRSADGIAYCWGSSGSLGVLGMTSSSVPLPVSAPR